MRPAAYDSVQAALGCVDALRESVSALRPQELLDVICGIEVLVRKTHAAMLELVASLDATGLGPALNQVRWVRACRAWGAGCSSSRRGIGFG